MSHTVTLIPGDGIGPEITKAAQRVIAAAGVPIEWEEIDAGERALATYGTPLPREVLDSIARNKVALKGPITTPVGHGFRSINVALRKHFDLFANIRRVRTIPGVPSRYRDVDIVVFRENTEGLYAGIESMEDDNTAKSIRIITRGGSERICRAAFSYAKDHGRRRVTAGHKANILKLGDGLFLQTARKVAGAFPTIEFDDIIVDALCMKLVTAPEQFDVLVLPNLYGDIVSDLCAGLVGGLGLAPAANVGQDCAMFEAVHGSAPDIAGTGIANPIALILSSAMLLRHLGEQTPAACIERAVTALLEQGANDPVKLTPDLGGSASTEQLTDTIINLLEEAAA